ncbi:hypothetical protein [uncultured Pseudodesulfovibrio sp.]|uniref:hypothetical protein n=1 Tax=uncultured Pseudodesulfovibrio sp. TaxID=2035858 RepID=UPI0029C84FA9|nr:hypothetical protein [uncultured Pseudodesulfovibrio sp.]
MGQPDIKMNAEQQNSDQDANEERALSVFASEKSEDLTALVMVMIVTFMVLLFTKWLA